MAKTTEVVTPQQLDDLERWFGDKQAARAFKDSLQAGGVLLTDLLKVSAAIDAMSSWGITRECLLLLIQAQCPNMRNGRPMPKETIDQVLKAMSNLKNFVKPEALAAQQVLTVKDTSTKRKSDYDDGGR